MDKIAKRNILKEQFKNALAPSILACDPLEMKAEIAAVAEEIPALHVDIMDNHFVPNINGSYELVKSIKTNFPQLLVDVHLMVENPESMIDGFVEAGADLITMHLEALIHPHRYLNYIKDKGVLAGISLNPGTPVSLISELLESTDVLLLMSVNPGFGGQKFIESTFAKINKAKAEIEKAQSDTLIEIDGGVKAHNAKELWNSGADILVAGSAVFAAENSHEAIKQDYKDD